MYPDEYLNKIKRSVTELANDHIEELVRRNALGEIYSFKKLESCFKQIIRLFFHVNNLDFKNILQTSIEKIDSLSSQTAQLFKEVKAFELGNDDVKRRHEIISKQIIDNAKDLESEIMPMINYYRLEELEKKPTEATSSINNMMKQMKQSRDTARADLSKLKEIVENARSAAGEISLSKHAEFFKAQAESHKSLSTLWLWITGVFTLITLGVGTYFVSLYFNIISYSTTAQAIQMGVAKLIIFGILSFSIVWAGRVYKAHQHNYVVNIHRQNALSTFEAFVEAAEGDKDIRNAVLLRASEAIFSPQHSGFLTQEPEPNPSTKVMEIVRGGDH